MPFHFTKKRRPMWLAWSPLFFSSCFWESSVVSFDLELGRTHGNLIHKVFFIKKEKKKKGKAKYMDKRNFVSNRSINDYGFQSNMILRI